MKRITTYLLFALFPMLMHAQEDAYLDQIRVADYQLRPVANDMVQLEMTLRFDELRLDAQHALRIIPMLVSADGKHNYSLDPVQLYGKQRYKVQQRANRLNNVPMTQPGDRLHHYSKGNTAPLGYTAQLPFQPWMVDSRLHIEAQVVGCAQCDEGTEFLSLASALLPATLLTPQQTKTYLAATGWQPLYAEAQPIPAENKLHSDGFRAYIQFAQGSHAIRPQLGDNKQQLDAIFASLKQLTGDQRLTLTAIDVQGYASPEGNASLNQRLSERRARSLVDYVARQMPDIDRSLFRAEGRGEAWSQLQAQLQEEPLPQVADLVQQAIGNPSQQDAIDRQMRQSSAGSTLMKQYYPRLRHIAYSANYQVRPIGIEEGRTLIDTHPSLLSPNELQQVADSYLPDTEQYIAALQKAVKTYPEHTALAYNLALAQYKADRPQEALQTLTGLPSTAAISNLRGVILYRLGSYDDAVGAFRQAANLGSTEAKNNLVKLKIKR